MSRRNRLFAHVRQPFASAVFCLFFVAGLAGSWIPAAHAVTNIVWSDEFNGTSVDTTKWSYDIGNSSSIAGSGWGNQEREYYTSRTNNALVSGGLLHIIANKESLGGFPYTSARLISLGHLAKKYGRIEWRARLPHGLGYWPALWLLATNYPSIGWPQCGETDVVESQGVWTNQVQGTINYGSSGNVQRQSTVYTLPTLGDSVTNFHTYALYWATNSMTWIVDGQNVKTWTTWSSTEGAFPAPFNTPFYIIMNLAVGGQYLGSPSDATINANTVFPGEVDVDYVRIYDDTPPGPLILSISPTNGCLAGGTSITISGSNFQSNASIIIGASSATSVTFVNSNTLTAVTPANSAGPQNITVTVTNSLSSMTPPTYTLSGTLSNGFTYGAALSFGGLGSASGTSNGATLSWSAATGTAPVIYKVFQASTSGGENFASPVTNTTNLSAFITPLSVGSNCSTTYYFVVRATDGCGSSESNVVEKSVQFFAAPPTFAGLSSVTAATESATLSWSSGSGLAPLTYNVFEATTSGGENFASPLLTTNGLSVLVAPLYPGSNSPITYFFVVRAVDACSNSDANVVELSIQPLLDPTKSQVGDGIPNGWKQQYGFNPFDPALATEDPDGDGMSNLQEYLAGTDPTNSASYFHVISVTPEGSDICITWMCGSGRTNAVQSASDLIIGYSDISSNIILTGVGVVSTNFCDVGAATNTPAYFYRVRLVP